MKKPKIKIRSLVYSALGIAASSVFVLMLMTQIPNVPTARTDLSEYPGGMEGGMDEETPDAPLEETPVAPKEEVPSVSKGIEMSGYLLGDNPYQVTKEKIDTYLSRNVFRYGRWNPMMYSTTVAPVEPEAPAAPVVEELPAEEPKPSGITLDLPDGEKLTLEYTTGKMPLASHLYKVEKIYGMVGEAFHYGTDLASEGIENAEVYSVLPGKISNVGQTDEYGNYAVVNHGTVSSLYAHLQENIPVTIGERVLAGDVIGYVGMTGSADHPHLHFEMDVDGVRFNPEIFIKQITS